MKLVMLAFWLHFACLQISLLGDRIVLELDTDGTITRGYLERSIPEPEPQPEPEPEPETAWKDFEAWYKALPAPTYSEVPANALKVDRVDQVAAAINLNLRTKVPVHVQGVNFGKTVLHIPDNASGIWVTDCEWDGSNNSYGTIRAGIGASEIHIYRNTFRNCGIAIYVHSTRTRVVGNKVFDGKQGLHTMWYTSGMPARDITIEHNWFEDLSGHDVELQTHHAGQDWLDLRPRAVNGTFRYNVSKGKLFYRYGMPNDPARRMGYSIATGSVENFVVDSNYVENGDAAFEVMNGCVFTNNIVVGSNHAFYINARSTKVEIGSGNVFIGVPEGQEIIAYPDGQYKGINPQWKLPKLVTKGNYKVTE